MQKPTRIDIFSLAAKKLRHEFEELRTVPHPGVKGAESEGLLRAFLNSHLPRRFQAGAGFIIDHDDHVTGHNDVIIYDALNCPLYRASEDAAIVPNDNVAAVIEVKFSLDKERLYDAAEKISDAKLLAKTKPQRTVDPYGQPINYETLGIAFAFDTPLTIEKLSEHYKATILDHGLPNHIDYVFVLDKGMLSLTADPLKQGQWAPMVLYHVPPTEGVHLAVGSIKLGEETLDTFIRSLLAHLQFFRHSIDHPGFNWSIERTGKQARIDYLTSITHEADPTKRELRLQEYREEARRLIVGN